jgi:peptide-methionine (S)-S-oxide reductase
MQPIIPEGVATVRKPRQAKLNPSRFQLTHPSGQPICGQLNEVVISIPGRSEFRCSRIMGTTVIPYRVAMNINPIALGFQVWISGIGRSLQALGLLLILGLSLLSWPAIAAPMSPSSDSAATIGTATPLAAAAQSAQAIFAGGCFWCMEKPFDQLPGVSATISGYSGGSLVNPSYGQVSAGNTGHREVVQVTYDPAIVDYETLLSVFWHNVDPLDPQGQFCDKGSQYTSAIFVADEAQRKAAEASKQALESQDLKQPIVTSILAVAPFYAAEDYHQNFYQTNAAKYQFYRFGCGRDRRLEQLWGDKAGH